jgi:hypothetical protein
MTRKRWPWLAIATVVALTIIAYTQLTLFVLQPVGAVPDGEE